MFGSLKKFINRLKTNIETHNGIINKIFKTPEAMFDAFRGKTPGVFPQNNDNARTKKTGEHTVLHRIRNTASMPVVETDSKEPEKDAGSQVKKQEHPSVDKVLKRIRSSIPVAGTDIRIDTQIGIATYLAIVYKKSLIKMNRGDFFYAVLEMRI